MEMQESAHESRPLDYERAHQQSDAQTGEHVASHVRHQEAETNEHHHVDILEHCNDARKWHEQFDTCRYGFHMDLSLREFGKYRVTVQSYM